jgi:PAS domain S-box-containing protein
MSTSKTSDISLNLDPKIKKIFERLSDSFFIIDKKFNLLYTNRTRLQNAKNGIPESKHKNLLLDYPNFTKTVFYKEYKIALKLNKSRKFEAYYEDFNKWYEVSVHPYNGGLLVQYLDITSQRILKDDLYSQRHRLEIAQKAARIGIFDWDIKTGKTFWSSEQEKLFSISANSTENYRKYWAKIVHKDDLPRVRKLIDSCIKNHKAFETEFRIVLPDKSVRWMRGKANAFYDSQGKPSRFIGVNMDITNEKNRENSLKESESQFRSMAENAPVMIWLLDIKKSCYYFNKRWLGFRGRTLEQEIGAGWAEGIHPDDFDKCQKASREAFSKRGPFEVEYRLKRYDGKYRWVLDSGAPRYSSKKEFLGYIGSCMDIDDRKHMEDMLLFKSEASKILSSSLDYEITLASVANIAVPRMADWCTVDILDNDGKLKQIAVAHKDKEKIEMAYKLRKKYPPEQDINNGLIQVIKSGKSFFIPLISDEMLVAGAMDKTRLNLLRKIGFTSVMIVPLKSQGHTIGAITFVSAESKTQYSHEDLRLAEQLAERASLAIENARLYSSLQEQSERANKTIANVPGVVWETYQNTEGTNYINYVSDYVEKMIGYTPTEWLAKTDFWANIIHPEDREVAVNKSNEFLKTGQAGINRYRWITKDGKIIWVEAYTSIIKDKKGKIIGRRGVSMDVTERIELEKRKDEFISMASHELKTPITSLKAYAQLLQKHLKELDPESQLSSYAMKMEGQIDRLTKLIQDLLDLSKIQAGKLEYNMEKIQIQTLVEEIVDNVQQTISTHKIILEGKVKGYLKGDRDRISQVIINLLTNAVKYSPGKDKIKLIVQKDKKHLHIKVQDFGIGISKINQKRIFDRFFQVNDNDNSSFSGLGIGLHLSYEIAKRHRGSISVESAKGKGSIFDFQLPIS